MTGSCDWLIWIFFFCLKKGLGLYIKWNLIKTNFKGPAKMVRLELALTSSYLKLGDMTYRELCMLLAAGNDYDWRGLQMTQKWSQLYSKNRAKTFRRLRERQFEMITLAKGAGWACEGKALVDQVHAGQSCWPAGNQVPLTGTGDVIHSMAQSRTLLSDTDHDPKVQLQGQQRWAVVRILLLWVLAEQNFRLRVNRISIRFPTRSFPKRIEYFFFFFIFFTQARPQSQQGE